MIDERIIKVLKEMAYGEVHRDDWGSSCFYCNGPELYDWKDILIDRVEHEADCPIILSRVVLREMKTPLKVYKVTYEYVPGVSIAKEKQEMTMLSGGYSEEEVQAKFPEGEQHNHYNVQIAYVKSL